MIFEIINPSDKYTIEADDFKVACIAGLVIGDGQVGLEQVDGDLEMPIFIFGGVEEWFQEQFDTALTDLFKSIDMLELADCMDSIVVGNRDAYLLGLDGKTGQDAYDFWLKWHDTNRSSVNDYGTFAKAYAKDIRKRYGETISNNL